MNTDTDTIGKLIIEPLSMIMGIHVYTRKGWAGIRQVCGRRVDEVRADLVEEIDTSWLKA